MMKMIKAACHAARIFVERSLSSNKELAEASEATIVGACALQRFTIDRLVQMGKIEAVMNMLAAEQAVYQWLVEEEQKQIREAHERKVAASRAPPDSFQQRPGTC